MPLAGQPGFLEFVLSASGVPPTETALIDQLAVIGGTPNPGSNISLNNASRFDFLDVAVLYGTQVRFNLTLATGTLSFPLSNSTTFSLGLFDSLGNALINTANGAGPVLTIDL